VHVLIDTNIYRADRKRNTPAFRAVMRLAQASMLHLHIPTFIKGEVLSQQQRDVKAAIKQIKTAAAELSKITGEANLQGYATQLMQLATAMTQGSEGWIATDLQAWIAQAQAIENPIGPDHGERVAAAYFAGSPPFGQKKVRADFPDSFIWETSLDIVNEHGELAMVSADGRLRAAAEKHPVMEAYSSLEEFISTDDCQDGLEELTASDAITDNIGRIKKLLPDLLPTLKENLDTDLVNELASKTVRHHAIPDDNNEATITSVDATENLEFTFTETEHFGDGDIGIPFTATVECELNYTLYKGDYYSQANPEEIYVEEWNDHYFDAHQTFTLSVSGWLNLTIDTEPLKDPEITDDDLRDIINDAGYSVEVTERDVHIPEY
jgi:hypothetical protein